MSLISENGGGKQKGLVVLAQAKKGEDRQHNYNETDQIDDAIHGFPPHGLWYPKSIERQNVPSAKSKGSGKAIGLIRSPRTNEMRVPG